MDPAYRNIAKARTAGPEILFNSILLKWIYNPNQLTKLIRYHAIPLGKLFPHAGRRSDRLGNELNGTDR
jgi:hypothetical protein